MVPNNVRENQMPIEPTEHCTARIVIRVRPSERLAFQGLVGDRGISAVFREKFSDVLSPAAAGRPVERKLRTREPA